MSTEDMVAKARTWAGYLNQGETWIPATGVPVKVMDMDQGWRSNAARWLLRRAGVLEFYCTFAEVQRLTSMTGQAVLGEDEHGNPVLGPPEIIPLSDHVEDALMREMDQRADDPQAWLKTTTLYRALVAD
ncbi:hypothetical protein ACIBI0_38695 [Microbispora rosea]|uniref:hypothetical protein n=1 Tax=Microbispora rosea TaxID=58117 RepID=UPI0037A37153